MTPCADRIESLVQDAVQELLAGSVTDAALYILLLELFQAVELWPELCEILR